MWFDPHDYPYYIPIVTALTVLPAVRHVADQPAVEVKYALSVPVTPEPAVAQAIDKTATSNGTFPVIQE